MYSVKSGGSAPFAIGRNGPDAHMRKPIGYEKAGSSGYIKDRDYESYHKKCIRENDSAMKRSAYKGGR